MTLLDDLTRIRQWSMNKQAGRPPEASLARLQGTDPKTIIDAIPLNADYPQLVRLALDPPHIEDRPAGFHATRTRCGIPQTQAAHDCHVNEATIRRWENPDTRWPPTSQAMNVARRWADRLETQADVMLDHAHAYRTFDATLRHTTPDQLPLRLPWACRPIDWEHARTGYMVGRTPTEDTLTRILADLDGDEDTLTYWRHVHDMLPDVPHHTMLNAVTMTVMARAHTLDEPYVTFAVK